MAGEHRPRTGIVPLLFTMVWIVGLPSFLLFANRSLAAVPVLKADRVAFALAAGAFLITARRRRSFQSVGRVELAMVVYAAVVLISWATTLRSKDPAALKQDADFILTCFVMPFAAYVIARNTPWSGEWMAASLWAVVAGVGGYLLVFGAVQYTCDWSFLVPEGLRQIHPDRAKGPFENAVPYGVVVSMLVPLTLVLFLGSRRRWVRLMLLGVAVGLVQSAVASKTRAVWVALPAALILPSLRYPRIRPVAALLTAQLAVQVLLAPAIGFDAWALHKRLMQPEPVYNRVAVSATASNMIQHRPLFGFGFGMFTFQDDKASYYASWGNVSPEWAVYPNNPHNDLLNVFVMMGVCGLVAYLALLGTIWQALWSRQRDSRPGEPFGSELALFVHAAFIVLLIAAQFHSVMHMSYAQVLFFFLLGMAARTPAARAAGGQVVGGASAAALPLQTGVGICRGGKP